MTDDTQAVLDRVRARIHGAHGPQSETTVDTDDLAHLLATVDALREDARRYRVLAEKSGHGFCQADGFSAWYFSGPVVDLTRDMPTMNEYADAIAARVGGQP